jgi:hypothetical protein
MSSLVHKELRELRLVTRGGCAAGSPTI